MKKISLFICMCMLMVACGGEKRETAESNIPQNKVLILFYSQTGATAAVANQIKSYMNADIEEIVCQEPYSGNFEATIERCKKEHESGVLPALKPIKSDVRNYDIIFLGYPIWFGTYALPVASLLEKIHLEGKMIVPFCTFGSGGLESSIKDLKEQLPRSIVMDGFGIRNARMEYMQEELDDFLIRNGYLQGEVEELPEFNVQDELSESDKNVFHQACDDYQFPLGTPTSVSKRYTSKGTEFRFMTRDANDAVTAKTIVYVELRNEKGAKAEFTKVVR